MRLVLASFSDPKIERTAGEKIAASLKTSLYLHYWQSTYQDW